MLFAVSGSQGSGKSTVIKALQDRGYSVVTRKTSRSILTDWGVTLNEVNSNPILTMEFQEEILKRKLKDEKFAVEDVGRIWFTERTYADLFTYALIALGKDNGYSDWLNDYYKKCLDSQSTYTHNFYLAAGVFPVENDGVRGANEHYVRLVDNTMQYITKQMSSGSISPPAYNVIQEPTVDERVYRILSTISPFLVK